ncbi:MAG: flavodoxin family protein [Planctomycetota bacterium]|jgi:NAD(P)H dehydrogenase (quinone)
MGKVLVFYYSRGGTTKAMAEFVAEGARSAGADVDLREVADLSPGDLRDYDGIVAGSPTYYGNMAAEIKKLIDESVRFHGKLEGKVGGAFSSAANIGGGNETTIRAILDAWLIHGMIVQGTAHGDHYGPVSIRKPDDRVEKQCRELGGRVAKLVDRLAGGG